MGQKPVAIEELDDSWVDYVVGSQICDRKPRIFWMAGGSGLDLKFEDRSGRKAEFYPSSRWIDGGPLLEQFKISLKYDGFTGWTASVEGGESRSDFHALRAAMRALIASKIEGVCYIPTY